MARFETTINQRRQKRFDRIEWFLLVSLLVVWLAGLVAMIV